MNRSRITIAGLAVLALAACSDRQESDSPLAPSEANLSRDPAPVKEYRGSRKIPDQYIVVLKEGSDPAAVIARHDVAPLHTYGAALKGFAAKMNRGQVQKLQHDAAVAYVEEDGEISIQQDPTTDPKNRAGSNFAPEISAATVQGGATWGIDKLDQEWGGGLDGNYNYTDTGLGVNVYVLDTGIRYTHNDFDGAALNRARRGIDIIAPGGNAADCNGHGTHVAGTIGGTTYGVAKAVRLYAVRVLDCAGNGTISGVIAGIDWVTHNHVKPAVANMSLGGGFSQALNDAVAHSISWGVPYVLAAGNSSADACSFSPASTPGAITVAASDYTNTRWAGSNYGACTDLYAPGVNITSAWYTSDVAVGTISGTSMAAPHVAGLAALYLGANRTAPTGMVTDVIVDGSVNTVVLGNVGATPNRLAHKVNGILGGAGAAVQEPDVFNNQWYYWSNTAGYHYVWLRGTPGTNYDLEFYQWNGSAWVKVAQRVTTSTNEILKYSGAGGFYYMYLVKSVSGAGTYDAYNIRPD